MNSRIQVSPYIFFCKLNLHIEFISVSASYILDTRREAEIQLPERDTHAGQGSMHRSRNNDVGNRWPHHGWNGGDQMAGLVVPAERHEMAGQLGMEGVHQHHQHDNHGSTHPFTVNMTLVSEMNGTIHDWPWPASVATHKR